MQLSGMSLFMIAALVLVSLMSIYGHVKMGRMLQGLEADCISRNIIISRVNHWANNQATLHSIYHGYQTTSYGFLAMCWAYHEQSFTSKSLGEFSHKIPYQALEAGDAIVCQGEVWLFDSWLNQQKTHMASFQTSKQGFTKSIASYPPGDACECLRYNYSCQN